MPPDSFKQMKSRSLHPPGAAHNHHGHLIILIFWISAPAEPGAKDKANPLPYSATVFTCCTRDEERLPRMFPDRISYTQDGNEQNETQQ